MKERDTKILKENKQLCMLENGVYDGRYKIKIVRDKKKTQYLKFQKNKKSQINLRLFH